MTDIYLIRHAQAGARDDYDVLSDLGREQARLLGEHLSDQALEFAAIYSGGMRRQRETAKLCWEALLRHGRTVPPIRVDDRWNEFSLISLYRGIVTRLIADDPELARDFAEMQEALKLDPHTTRGATGRCDAAVIRAWMEDRYPDYEGESWVSFRNRIESIPPNFARDQEGGAVAVFTSATPIAILTSEALGLSNEKLISILGVISNTSVTVLRSASEVRLFSFNSTPHLNARTRTYR